MLSLSQEPRDPELLHGGTYRPLAFFAERLAEAEEERRVEAARAELLRQKAEAAALQPDLPDADAAPPDVTEQVAAELAGLPSNRAFTSVEGNWGHQGDMPELAREYGTLAGGGTATIKRRLPAPVSSCWDRAEAAPELETSHREARTTCAACGVETTHTEAEVRKLLARQQGKSRDVAAAAHHALKRVAKGERHAEVAGFPGTDAGVRNAVASVQYQSTWRRRDPGAGLVADSALRWLDRAESRLPAHAEELQRMLGWRKAAAEMKRAEGDIASLRAQLGKRKPKQRLGHLGWILSRVPGMLVRTGSTNESGAQLLSKALDLCYTASQEV